MRMPDDVIGQVHRIARQQKAHAGMVFEDLGRVHLEELYNNYDDSDEDDDYAPDDDDQSDEGSFSRRTVNGVFG